MKFGAYHMDIVFLIMAAAFVGAIHLYRKFRLCRRGDNLPDFRLKKIKPAGEEENLIE